MSMPELADMTAPVAVDDPAAWLEANTYMCAEVSPNKVGNLSLEQQPWMRDILASFLDPSIRHLHLVMGTQTGKTTACILGTALLIEHDPAPLIWALPTDELAKRHAKTRLLPFLESNPYLTKHLPPKKKRKMTALPMDNMNMYVMGARSPARLASIPAAYVIDDEEAKFEHVKKDESHPVLLLQERTKSFSRSRSLMVHASTPNTETNYFWQGWLKSDQRHYFIPCPKCGFFQRLVFDKAHVVWDMPARGKQTADNVAATARYLCEHCSAPLTDLDLAAAMPRGEWRALNPDASAELRGYHLNSLYSPFVTLGGMAREWWQAYTNKTDITGYQNFINSWLGLPFTHYQKRISDDDVEACASNDYRRGECPYTAEQLAFAAVGYDPGERQTHWASVAINKDGEMAVMDWGTVLAIEDIPAHFRGLSYTPRGADEPTQKTVGVIDSGDWTMRVYDICSRAFGELFPSKGSTAAFGSWGHTAIKTHPGLRLLTYRDFDLKRALYVQRIAEKEERLFLPRDYDEELVQGLTGQEIRKAANGKNEFKKLPDDHIGDCVKLCLLAWWSMGREIAKQRAAELESSQKLEETVDTRRAKL